MHCGEFHLHNSQIIENTSHTHDFTYTALYRRPRKVLAREISSHSYSVVAQELVLALFMLVDE
jgi:hypothetical protein